MPIYEYHCDECGTEFERLVPSPAEVAKCECGNEKVERRWSVFAAHTAAGSSSSSAGPACPTCPMGGSCGLS